VTPGAAFYCVTGRDFFPGAVALLNSLRLQGHTEPFFLLDCGMEPAQRELIAPQATILDAPVDGPPSTRKLVAPRMHPADVMVVLDADLIVTHSLAELIEIAGRGKLVAFRNDTERHFPEWKDLLDLEPVRRGPYLTSSAVLIGRDPAERVLGAVEERQRRIAHERTWVGGGQPSDPLYYLDQDVLNAVAYARLAPDEIVPLRPRLAPIPPFDGVRLLDERRLRCVNPDGSEPYALHHCFRKPWLVPVRTNVYTRLLTRLLLSDDLPIRLPPGHVPPRLRRGAVGAAARSATDAALVPAGVWRRVRRNQPRVTAWPHAGR
jgi:hypothetical protein